MGYIKFDKKQLINLNYSLSREKLRTNRAGSYASSTIINCNTRSYHGLLVAPQPLIDDNNHVLLADLHETLRSNDFEFHLGSRMYQGDVIEPKGHKYLRDYEMDPIPRLVYRLGNIVLVKELIFTQKEDRILIRYTLEESAGKVTFQFRPFLAFRSVHSLSKSNTYVNTHFKPAKNGVSWQMYQGYSPVYMQFSKKAEYVHVPDWYYNVKYIREQERGYDYLEDLYTPGYFETTLEKGESLVISAALDEENPAYFKRKFVAEIKKRVPRSNFENSLQNAAEEFIIHVKNRTEIIAGYPWFGRWGRDTFISLPGLTLTRGDTKTFHAVVKTMLHELKNGLFPNLGHGKEASYNSVDTSLWFFWALHQYVLMTGSSKGLWQSYGKAMRSILNHYKTGTLHQIKMHDNGLIWAGEPGNAVTWMDAIVAGKPVTGRIGFAVEINALWYEAIRFALQLAEEAGDKNFVSRWKKWPEKIEHSFAAMFWDGQKGVLADYVTYENKDFTIRPNMVIAVSLPFTPATLDMKIGVLGKAKNELLTPRGLRSLSPRFPEYKGKYIGNQEERDRAYHQGTVWPWLLGPFSEAWLNLYGKKGKEFILNRYAAFEEVMTEAGVGTVSEIYDGDPPHEARGAISQAWSVAELLRIKWLTDHV
ncbi:amylo-alpha-1,6-glucosidase [Candidatus Sulfidibacterium hydrothermale]|uniref:amylo-alpha-1,6-glucosidase n=1 Tax=Candidatus Sulfidibacterium hydrothermale TaxID=2875962 RepID=UPI001F0A220D|nr:amylo-alpha-1,6-glucosidase [Candidatus Sulfidibacterium hydrothermale]UBM62648.1 amylo-alpha-1,6-glucosidase [Candidatus Sulfidibacterium hydrothermale]